MRLLVSFVCLMLIAGCGSGVERIDHPALTDCVGSVTYLGEPIEGALVLLVNDESSAKRWVPSATTDRDGRFEISTLFSNTQTEKGAIQGNYKVVISKYPDPPAVPATPHEVHLAQAKEILDRGTSKKKANSKGPGEYGGLLPEKYSSEKSTPLTVDVAAGSPPISFDLED
jgi:hypothetical protein